MVAMNVAASIRDEPGCLQFDVCSVEGQPYRFIFYELYTDAAAFDAHKAAPHFSAWRAVADRVLVSQEVIRGQVLHRGRKDSG